MQIPKPEHGSHLKHGSPPHALQEDEVAMIAFVQAVDHDTWNALRPPYPLHCPGRPSTRARSRGPPAHVPPPPPAQQDPPLQR